jgi:hypothetical protein
MIFVLKAEKIAKKIILEKNLGPKYPKNPLFSIKKSENLNYTIGTIVPWYLYVQNRIKEKNYPAACRERTNSDFQKKTKKAEKTVFEHLWKAQILFS